MCGRTKRVRSRDAGFREQMQPVTAKPRYTRDDERIGRAENRMGVNGSASRRQTWPLNQKTGRDQRTWFRRRASRGTNDLAPSAPVSEVTMTTLASSERSEM
ncbi:hypothetical protein MKX08_003759 [Trichoderma sp. CBMAI-0020]|nr:hypothetical protein MKX08_003759 [Trichoderma sp. CBMAI-0020]